MSSVVTIPHSTSITANSILTTTGWESAQPVVNINNRGITLQDGDIYRMSDKATTGVFDRLERLERMMGILRRDRTLESVYKPLQEAGDKYDNILDTAIADIMNIAIDTMKSHADYYDQLTVEAKVYHALTKEESK